MRISVKKIVPALTVLLGILFIPGKTVFPQNTKADGGGNEKVISDENQTVNEQVEQKGMLNFLFIHSDAKDLYATETSNISGLQKGLSNRMFIFRNDDTSPFRTYLLQEGQRNKAIYLQRNGGPGQSKSDSTNIGKNSITIKQRGNNNSATIIQN